MENGHFVTFPGADAKLIKHNLPRSIATSKGHITQERQKLQSTKLKMRIDALKEKRAKDSALLPYTSTLLDIHNKFQIMKSNLKQGETLEDKLIILDAFPASDSPNLKTKAVLYSMFEFNEKSMGYMNLTGRFPYCSSRGNDYIMVVYNYDGNQILKEPVKK